MYSDQLFDVEINESHADEERDEDIYFFGSLVHRRRRSSASCDVSGASTTNQPITHSLSCRVGNVRQVKFVSKLTRNFTVREVRRSTRERCVWGFAGQETDSKINGSRLPRTLFEVRLGRSNERWTTTKFITLT
jgi:hypothetical protein